MSTNLLESPGTTFDVVLDAHGSRSRHSVEIALDMQRRLHVRPSMSAQYIPVDRPDELSIVQIHGAHRADPLVLATIINETRTDIPHILRDLYRNCPHSHAKLIEATIMTLGSTYSNWITSNPVINYTTSYPLDNDGSPMRGTIMPRDLDAALTELHKCWTHGGCTQEETDDLIDDVVGLYAAFKGLT